MRTLLLIILILILLGALPPMGLQPYGYWPSSTLLLVIILILLLT